MKICKDINLRNMDVNKSEFSRLSAVCKLKNISYVQVKKAYNRYLSNVSKDVVQAELILDGYDLDWFPLDKERFLLCVHCAIIADKENCLFKKYSRGDISQIVYKLSELNSI